MMLSKQDLVHYEIFGFILMKNMLSQKEIQTITSEFEIGLIRAEKQTERQSFRKQLNWWNMGPDTPYLASILEKAKFLDIANQVLNMKQLGHSVQLIRFQEIEQIGTQIPKPNIGKD